MKNAPHSLDPVGLASALYSPFLASEALASRNNPVIPVNPAVFFGLFRGKEKLEGRSHSGNVRLASCYTPDPASLFSTKTFDAG